MLVKILNSPTVVPSARLTAKGAFLLHIIKEAAVFAAPSESIVDELNAALFNCIEPVPFAVSDMFKFVPPPVADKAGPVVPAPFAIVISLTALPAVVNFINSLPFISFKDVPIIGVLIVGDVNVLLVKVSVDVLATKVSAPDGIVTVPPFVIEAIVGVVRVLFVNVCVATSKTTAPVTSGIDTTLSAVGSTAINLVSKLSVLTPSKITAESTILTFVLKIALSPPSCVYNS